jgi:prepilin-type N-terminal cleavage/methylation domain-containing protein
MTAKTGSNKLMNRETPRGLQMMRQRQIKFRPKGPASGEAGMTLIELMIAITVLAIGMLGAMGMILMGMQTDSRSKTDTTATVLDQEIIEGYSTLKNYPQPTFVTINDCALNGANAHEADLGQGAMPAGNGAVLYTAATAPSAAQVGDIDWTQPVPTLATAATPGYAMEYQTCSGDIYEVRWNVMNLTPAAPPAGSTGRLSLLTVSARPRSAVSADAAGTQNRAVLYAWPVTLRTMIEQ